MVRAATANPPLAATLEKAQQLMEEPYSVQGREKVRVILDMLLDMVQEEEQVARNGVVMKDAVADAMGDAAPTKKAAVAAPASDAAKPAEQRAAVSPQRSDTEYATADEKSPVGSGTATPDQAALQCTDALPASRIPAYATSATYHARAPVAWDISGSLYTQDALKAEFKKLDAQRHGYLELEAFKAYYLRSVSDDFGLGGMADISLVERIHRQFNRIGHGKVSFDEFSLVMLRVAGR